MREFAYLYPVADFIFASQFVHPRAQEHYLLVRLDLLLHQAEPNLMVTINMSIVLVPLLEVSGPLFLD